MEGWRFGGLLVWGGIFGIDRSIWELESSSSEFSDIALSKSTSCTGMARMGFGAVVLSSPESTSGSRPLLNSTGLAAFLPAFFLGANFGLAPSWESSLSLSPAPKARLSAGFSSRFFPGMSRSFFPGFFPGFFALKKF
jgi:hypothetical protein